jgi:tRNA-dihydrouridine synthase 3
VSVAVVSEAAGADAIGVHGRARNQHYRRNADWDLIAQVAAAVTIPILGNGDILTPWDLSWRLEGTAVTSVLVARGALIKPWIFQELRQGSPLEPTLAERWAVMRQYYDFATEYFGSDGVGQQRVKRFFLWHLGFWHRYRHYTEADFLMARPSSLIQTRDSLPVPEGEPALLASADPADHERIWQRVLDRDFPAA